MLKNGKSISWNMITVKYFNSQVIDCLGEARNRRG